MKFPKIQTIYGFLSRLSKREKAIFYIAAIFVLVTALDRLIIYPIYSHMKSLDKDIEEKERALKNYMKIISQKDRLKSELAKYATFLNTSKSEVQDINALLKELEGLTSKSSVYLIDMKPAGTKESGQNKKYLVTLSLEGNMEQIADFMYNIENSSKLLQVERFQISPKSKGSNVAQCSMTVSQVVIQ